MREGGHGPQATPEGEASHDPERARRREEREARRAERRERTAAAETTQHLDQVGNQFLWIAGLSLVGSLSFYATAGSGGFVFFVALGVTFTVDLLAMVLGPQTRGVSLAVGGLCDALAALVFLVIGVLARSGRSWAIALGLGLYALDGCVVVGLGLLAPDPVIGGLLLFHVVVFAAIVSRWTRVRRARRAHAGPEFLPDAPGGALAGLDGVGRGPG